MQQINYSEPEIIKKQSIFLTQSAMNTLNKTPNIFKRIYNAIVKKFSKPTIIENNPAYKLRSSQPYIIEIENTDKVDRVVEVFGKHKNINLPNYGMHKKIKASSCIETTNYAQVVNDISEKNTEIGVVYIQSQNPMAVLEVLKLFSSNANGDIIEKSIVPILDPYQQISTTIAINTRDGFIIDGYLGMRLNILAKSSVRIYLFPASKGKTTSSFESLANNLGYFRNK